MHINDVSAEIVDAAIRVHRTIGPGLLESAYHACLHFELRKRGLRVEANVPLGLTYDGLLLDVGYRIDLRVESAVIVELKAVARIHPLHVAQLLSYLRLSECPLGLLLNFHEPVLRRGITRVVNRWSTPSGPTDLRAPRPQKRRPVTH